ncbi:MAG: hypothetical protein HUK03_10020, partial [Bacteroidaceae bacterium]|nr:hypothetical protein [Bacteroidaceae bacterium]
YCHLYYLGTEAEANLTEAVTSMKERANAVIDLYNTELDESLMPTPAVPIFSTTLKEQLQTAAAGGNTLQTAQTLSDLFQQIYKNKLDSRNIYYQYKAVENVACMDFIDIPEGVEPLIPDSDIPAWESKANELSDAYFDGAYSPEETANLDATLAAEGFAPIKKDGVWQLATPLNMLWFSGAAAAFPSLDGEMTADLNMGGVNFQPIGLSTNRYTGTFNGNGHTISQLYVSKPGATDIGLFGIVRDATIKNLKLDNTCFIAGDHYIGLVGGFDTENLLKMNGIETYATIECDQQNGAGLVGCLRDKAKAQIENCLVGGYIKSGKEGGEVSGWLASSSDTYVKNVLSVAQYNEGVVGFLRASDGPSFTNNYNLTGTTGKGSVTKASKEALADGSLAWRLNGSKAEDPIWFETLGTDTIPTLFSSSDVVYYYGGKYTNEKPYIALNPYAYQIFGNSTADGITITYNLNAQAQAVSINFVKAGATAMTVPGTTAAGFNEVVVTAA